MKDKQQELHRQIEYEVEQTLRCLDRIETVQPGPWYFSRLVSRIETMESRREKRSFVFSLKQLLRPALLILLIAINLISAIVIIQHKPDSTDNRQTFITEIAGDYFPEENTFENDFFESE